MRTAGSEPDSDHSTRKEFYEYYKKESLNPATRLRFESLRDRLLRLKLLPGGAKLDVADIGGGAGTQALIWAEAGHSVHSIDISRQLIELARERARDARLHVSFEVASATALPWPDQSMDVCLVPELLEHVEEWQSCLDEFASVLRPGCLVFLSTPYALCPRQQEFNLPAYSWYPGFLKRRYERLAKTTRPELANYATYPAVNWFTYHSLRGALRDRGFEHFIDRFDLAALNQHSWAKRTALFVIRHVLPFRFIAQVCSSGTSIMCLKSP